MLKEQKSRNRGNAFNNGAANLLFRQCLQLAGIRQRCVTPRNIWCCRCVIFEKEPLATAVPSAMTSSFDRALDQVSLIKAEEFDVAQEPIDRMLTSPNPPSPLAWA
jgi:hypothetical protein